MGDVTKINITQEDLAQAYTSGFADGSVVRDETAVSAEQYEKLQRSFTALTLSHSKLKKEHEHLIAEHNRIADAVVVLQRYRHDHDNGLKAFADTLNSMLGTLDALGEVSPF